MNYFSKKLSKCDIEMASSLVAYLSKNGVSFDDSGFPTFHREWFLTEEPEEILPFHRRNRCFDKSKTAICFNEPDRKLYPRIRAVFSDLPVYKQYLGVMAMDISVSRYMHLDIQRFNLLLNALFLAVLGVNGVKFAPPTRFGSVETIPLFRCYKEASLWSVGCIGTRKNRKEDREYEEQCRQAFLIIVGRPSVLLSYGQMRFDERVDWESFGTRVRIYKDFNERSRRGDLRNVR